MIRIDQIALRLLISKNHDQIARIYLKWQGFKRMKT